MCVQWLQEIKTEQKEETTRRNETKERRKYK